MYSKYIEDGDGKQVRCLTCGTISTLLTKTEGGKNEKTQSLISKSISDIVPQVKYRVYFPFSTWAVELSSSIYLKIHDLTKNVINSSILL